MLGSNATADPGPAIRTAVTPRPAPSGMAARMARHLPWVLVVLAGTYGTLVRVWLLAHLPLFGDEAVVGLMGRGILAGHLDAFYWGQNYGGAEPYAVAAVLGPINGGPMDSTPLRPSWLRSRPCWPMACSARVASVAPWRRWAAPWSGSGRTPPHGIRCARSVFEAPRSAAASSSCSGALRVQQHRAGMITRLILAGGAGWWASPEIVYFAVPAVVLLVAGWDRLFSEPAPNPPLVRTMARTPPLRDDGRHRHRRPPLALRQRQVGLCVVAPRHSGATRVWLPGPAVDLLPRCASVPAGTAHRAGWGVARREPSGEITLRGGPRGAGADARACGLDGPTRPWGSAPPGCRRRCDGLPVPLRHLPLLVVLGRWPATACTFPLSIVLLAVWSLPSVIVSSPTPGAHTRRRAAPCCERRPPWPEWAWWPAPARPPRSLTSPPVSRHTPGRSSRAGPTRTKPLAR